LIRPGGTTKLAIAGFLSAQLAPVTRRELSELLGR
jgi:hypothetical protein